MLPTKKVRFCLRFKILKVIDLNVDISVVLGVPKDNNFITEVFYYPI